MTEGQCLERHGHSRLDTVVFRVGESFMPPNPAFFISNFKYNKEIRVFSWAGYKYFSEEKEIIYVLA